MVMLCWMLPAVPCCCSSFWLLLLLPGLCIALNPLTDSHGIPQMPSKQWLVVLLLLLLQL
jgi:hypothetical protein